MRCEGIIPERAVPVGSEVVEVAPARYERQKLQDAQYGDVEVAPAQTEDRVIDGEAVVVVVAPAQFERREVVAEAWQDVMIEPAQTELLIHYHTTPEHPCEAEATMLSRSVKQERCSLGEPHWVSDGKDRAYCSACFKPGTVTDLAGTVNLHPAMSIDEYQEG